MLHDLRFAFRALTKSPGFTFVSVLMLALGIGASTACFTFLNAFFLRPPPFERPGELVSLHNVDEKTPGLMRLSFPNFTDIRAQNNAFTDLAFHQWISARLTEGEKNSEMYGQLVSGSFFELLGVKPALGRTLTTSDDRTEGASPVVVLSDAFWQSRFSGDASVIGRSILLNGTSFTVAGVMPVGFRGITTFDNPEFWVPAGMYRAIHTGQGLDFFTSRRAVTVAVFGRLKPGVTLVQAEASLRPIAEELAKTYPIDNTGRSLRAVPIAQSMLDPNMRADLLRAGNLLMALSGLILLIACANLANLLLARAGARQREMALRTALGASRRQVVIQLLQEHFLLAALGGVLGVVLTFWLRDLLWMLRPPGYPDNFKVEVDGQVLAFAVGATFLTGLLFGVIPALAAARVDLIAVLKRTPGSGMPLFSLRHLLVAAQVALSVVALVVAGLFVRSLQQTNLVNLGWNSKNLGMLSASIQGRGYDRTRTLEYYRRAIERLKSVPGVSDVSFASRPFLTGVNPQRTIRPQGEDDKMRTRGQFMSYAIIMPDFFRFMSIPLVAGRHFSEDDDFDRPPVVIVNETFARRFWPGQDAIGKTIKLFNSDTLFQIVGVTADIRDVDIRANPEPFAYFPVKQLTEGGNVLYVRTTGNPADLMPTLRKELQAIDPAISNLSRTYLEFLQNALWGPRTGAVLMSVFGAIALLLASLGIYAVMAQAVIQRTREIGIRLAIGAPGYSVLQLILKRGALVAGAGLLLGLAASLGLTHYVRSFLYGVSATDPLTLGVVALLLGAVALLACAIPAHRATKVDPLVTLRTE